MRKLIDRILPTTMVGSYPRPDWFRYQLHGRDVRAAFLDVHHEEAFNDATRVVIQDQEQAGIDFVTDGQMYFDDYVGSIGSFCWYMYERIPGFEHAKEEHPGSVGVDKITKEIALLSDWGGVVNSGPIGETSRLRLLDFYKLTRKFATRPIKVSVGAGPINLAWHVYFKHYKDPRELSYALAPIFNREMRALADAGANFLQYEDLGAWLPLFTKNDADYKWIGDVVRQCIEGVNAKIAWHFCYGNAWGNRLAGLFPAGYEAVLPHFYDLPIDQFVLDFANRNMADIGSLRSLPKDKEVAVGVIDVRTSMVETPEEVAARIRQIIKVVPPERVYLTTDCGMKPMARIIAQMKLKALAEGAAIVRKEIGAG